MITLRGSLTKNYGESPDFKRSINYQWPFSLAKIACFPVSFRPVSLDKLFLDLRLFHWGQMLLAKRPVPSVFKCWTISIYFHHFDHSPSRKATGSSHSNLHSRIFRFDQTLLLLGSFFPSYKPPLLWGLSDKLRFDDTGGSIVFQWKVWNRSSSLPYVNKKIPTDLSMWTKVGRAGSATPQIIFKHRNQPQALRKTCFWVGFYQTTPDANFPHPTGFHGCIEVEFYTTWNSFKEC